MKKALALLLICCMVLGMVPAVSASEDNTCGENLTWNFNTTTKTLTISGTGEMEDFSSGGHWSRYREKITSVVVEPGVTSIGQSAFYSLVNVTSISIPDSVTSIGDQAFDGCKKLTTLTIPDSVTFIGRYCFRSCESLSAMSIPEGITSVPDYAFEKCSSLASVTIPDSVTRIGDSAFSGCSSLLSIDIPQGVTVIGASAFQKCTSLTGITLPEGVTSIGSSAFSGCTGITSVNIPEGVTYLGGSAFYQCTSLTDINIPDKVPSIGSYTFMGCKNLASVTLGRHVESIGKHAFEGCKKLTTITLPESVTSIDEYAFIYCDNLTNVTIGNRVESIGQYGFYLCKNLTDLTLGSAITFIGDSAFAHCGNLKNISYTGSADQWEQITIERSNEPLYYAHIQYISDPHVHSYTSAVTAPTCTVYGYTTYTCSCGSVYTADPVPYPGHDFCIWTVTREPTQYTFGVETRVCATCDFSELRYMPKREAGDNTEQVTCSFDEDTGTLTFSGKGPMISALTASELPWYHIREKIISVVLEPGITSISNSGFLNCVNLTSVTIPDSVTSIGSSAFSNCSSLASLTIPNSVTSIGSSAFSGCTSLTSIVIPEGVSAIQDDTFYQCSSLTSVTIPNGMKSIGLRAFFLCASLTNVTLPESVTSIGGAAFADCKSLTSIVIPNRVTAIENLTFDRCSQLTSVTFGSSVKTIGQSAFADCIRLTTVFLPESVTTIKDHAFYNCIYLADVYYAGSAEQFDQISIHNYNRPLLDANIHYNADDTHVHSYTAVVTAPTCTEAGFTTYTCSVCGDSYLTDETPAFGHSFGNWYTVREATEDTDGLEQRDCARCGHAETRNTPRLDHVHSYTSVVTDPTCSEQGYTTHTCPCGDSYVDTYVDALGHQFGDWITLVQPTCSEDGRKIRSCARCFRGDPQPIEALGHDFVDGVCIRCSEVESAISQNPFTDVTETDYFYEPVIWAVENGITSGTSATTFAPNATCTRGQVVTFLWRAMGQPEPESTENPFTDVTDTDYFYKAVLWAKETGVTSGRTSTTFDPNAPCTRDQVVTFLWRAMGKPTPQKQDNPFSDVSAGIYYYEPVLWAVENGITSGTSATTFAPSNPCTRGQVVTFLYRAFSEK